MYSGYLLDPISRTLLLQRFIPKFPDVLAHHITEMFGVSKRHPLPPFVHEAYVVGYQAEIGLEVLVVAINGTVHRIDGRKYHITWSLNRSMGKKPFHSNKLLKAESYFPVTPVAIKLKPELFE